MNLKKKKKMKIAVALSGGATKGVAIFGVIEAAKKMKVEIECISGSSIGAIIGAYYALYGEIDTLKEKILGFDKKDWGKFVDLNTIPKKSLIKADYYQSFLEKQFGDKEFSDTRIPLIIPVTNLTEKKTEYISEGRIVDALIASSAYPGIFPFVEKNNKVYVDGGVLDNLPYEILVEKGFEKIVVINLDTDYKQGRKINNIFDVVSASFEAMAESHFVGLGETRKNLFMLSPKFPGKLGNSWSVSNLEGKYQVGFDEFERREEELLEWLGR